MSQMRINVPPEERDYTIHFGNNFFPAIAENLQDNPLGKKYAIITDSNVRPHAENLQICLENEGVESTIIEFPAGEANKTEETATQLRMQMHKARMERSDAVIAVGGGVTGDIAAYAAGVYLRGIPVVQVPTTTIAQADSSIGGKAGVDNEYGKNLAGLFHYPSRVFIDVHTLTTLPRREYLQGLTETVKHAVIQDAKFNEYLHNHLKELHAKNPEVLLEIARRNCKIKGNVVEQDPREKGLRRILNYGHTAGHAIETASNYELLHGEAVAIGMMVEARIAKAYGLSPFEVEAQALMLEGLGLETRIPPEITNEQILEIMKRDKKAKEGRPRFCLPERTGSMHPFGGEYATHIDPELVEKALNETRL